MDMLQVLIEMREIDMTYDKRAFQYVFTRTLAAEYVRETKPHLWWTADNANVNNNVNGYNHRLIDELLKIINSAHAIPEAALVDYV